MTVRILTIYAGPLGTFQPGELAELPDAEAKGLLKAGFAEVPKPAPADGDAAK